MSKDEMSKAEQYREERKARIAENAKKNAKNIEKTNTAKKILGKVVAIVLAAAIALVAVGYCLTYYGVWQRIVPAGEVGSDQKVTIAEYQYYYMQAYNQLSYYSQYYKQQGYDYGYDYTISPEKQTKTTTNADGKEISWVEYLHENTISMAQMYKTYYNEALKAGITLSKAEEATIDSTIEDYRTTAKNGGSSEKSENSISYTLNAYLRKLYGGAVTEGFLRKELKIQKLAQKFYQTRSEELAKSYTKEEIDKTYNESKDTYDLVDFRYYQFSTTELTQNDGESTEALATRQAEADAKVKSEAEAFYAAVKDTKSFIAQANAANKDTDGYNGDTSTNIRSQLKSGIESNYSADIATWLFTDSTKVGDKKLFSDTEKGTYTIVLMTKDKHQEDTVSVRHILFMTVDSSTGAALSDDEVAKAKTNADNALKSWKDGDKTEDSFATLANDLSEDTGANDGGLYENVLPGVMAKEFNDWCFNSAHKTGDVDIVKTSYGYHVMYFVSKNGPYYDATIRSSKASTDVEAEATKLLDGDDYIIGLGPRRSGYSEKTALKKINVLIEQQSASSAASAASSASSATASN